MKILSITAQKPHSTGSGTYLTELVRAFDRKGIDQAVVAGIYRDDTVNFPDSVQFFPVYFSCVRNASCSASDDDISYPIVGMSDVMPYNSTRYRDLNQEMIDEFRIAFMKQIQLAVDALDPDIILCHHLFLLTAMVREAFPDRRIYGICHGTDLRQMINCPALAEYVRPHIRQLDGIFALHDEQAEQLKIIDQLADDKIRVVGSGYNSTLFNADGRSAYIKGNPVRVCYAGKISTAKGIPELLAALEVLHHDNPTAGFHVTLAGGCTDDDLKERLSTLPDYIHYIGQIPQTELAKVFRTNDIFVLPSFYEGLNLASIEAMASGLIPLCTNLPGMQTWIDHNVTNANVRYISMPEMKTIDEPTESGRREFIKELAAILGNTINDIAAGITSTLPDTSGITWDSVAAAIINF